MRKDLDTNTVEKRSSESGAGLLEFSISLVFLIVLLQASIGLCEKLALKSWLENTSYQLVFASSQSPLADRNSEVTSRSEQVFDIFNNRQLKFWRLYPLESTDSQNTSGYPDVAMQARSDGLVNITVNGKAKSLWTGNSISQSISLVSPLSGSYGYNSAYESPNNAESSGGGTITFSCDNGRICNGVTY